MTCHVTHGMIFHDVWPTLHAKTAVYVLKSLAQIVFRDLYANFD